jgi:hypothetical protein
MPTADPADVPALLCELLAELRLLRLDLAEQRTAVDVRLGLLLRACAALGRDPFTAGQLVDLVSVKLSTRIALQAAVGGIVGRTKQPAKSLGKFLSAHAGTAADGLRLVRVRASVYRIESEQSPRAKTWPA